MKFIRIYLIAITILVLSNIVFAQKSANAQVEPERAGKVNQLFEQIQTWGDQIREVRENRKLERARDAVRATVPKNETRQFEVVTKGGTIPEGGKFVRIQPHVAGANWRGEGEVVSPSFDIGGGLELPGNELTKAEKKEMEQKAEQFKKAEQDLKDAEELQRKALEANELAEKARQAAEEQKRVAVEAAKIAEEQRVAQVAAERAAKIAARDEARAMRDGERLQQRIASERARYRAEGGPFRAPAGVGGAH